MNATARDDVGSVSPTSPRTRVCGTDDLDLVRGREEQACEREQDLITLHLPVEVDCGDTRFADLQRHPSVVIELIRGGRAELDAYLDDLHASRVRGPSAAVQFRREVRRHTRTGTRDRGNCQPTPTRYFVGLRRAVGIGCFVARV